MRLKVATLIFALSIAVASFADSTKDQVATGADKTFEIKVRDDGGSSSGSQINGQASRTQPKVVVPSFSTHSKAFQLQQGISGKGLRFAVGVSDMQDVDQVMKVNAERIKNGFPAYVIFVSGKTFSEKSGTPDTAFYEADDGIRITAQILKKYKDAVVITDFDSGFRNKDVAVDAAERLAKLGAAGILFDNQNDLHRVAATGSGAKPMALEDYVGTLDAIQNALKKGGHDLMVISRGANDTKTEGFEFADEAAARGAGALLLHSTMKDLADMEEMRGRYSGVPRVIIQLDKRDKGVEFHSEEALRKSGVSLVFLPDLIQKSAKESQVDALEKFSGRVTEEPKKTSNTHIFDPAKIPSYAPESHAFEFNRSLLDGRPTFGVGVADVQDADQVMKVNQKRIADGKLPFVLFVSGKTYSEKIGQPDHAFYRSQDAVRITEQIREKHPGAIVFTDFDAGFGNTNTAIQAARRLVNVGANGILWDNQSDLHRVAATGSGVTAISNTDYLAMLDGVRNELSSRNQDLVIIARGANGSFDEGHEFAHQAMKRGAGGILLHSTMKDLGRMTDLNGRFPGVPTTIIQLDNGDNFHSQEKLQAAGVNFVLLPDLIQKAAKEAQVKALQEFSSWVNETPRLLEAPSIPEGQTKAKTAGEGCDIQGFILSGN